MKYEVKDVLRALERATKDGAHQIEITHLGITEKLQIKYVSGVYDIIITIAPINSGLWNEITKTERF